jgi:hypothetical protein
MTVDGDGRVAPLLLRFYDSAADSLISRLMREISSTHRWRSRWDMCSISSFGQWKW